MIRLHPFVWGLAVGAVALLNVLDVLPDWATIAAILTMPLLTAINRGRGCPPRAERSQ